MLEFLGEGYGKAAHAVRCERQVDRTLARLGGDRSLQYVSYWHGSDDRYDDYYSEPGSAWKTTTLRQVLVDMVEYRDWRGRERSADFGELRSLSDVSDWFRDANDGDCGRVSRLYTDAEAHAERLERKRVELESTAAAFASRCGHKVGTREYVLAARKAVDEVDYQRERWNDPEVRAEQWAACRYAGSNSYFDDLNFENSRYDRRISGLQDVLDWLEQTCPMLMRQVESELVTQEEEC
jgi:hypothetical protein